MNAMFPGESGFTSSTAGTTNSRLQIAYVNREQAVAHLQQLLLVEEVILGNIITYSVCRNINMLSLSRLFSVQQWHTHLLYEQLLQQMENNLITVRLQQLEIKKRILSFSTSIAAGEAALPPGLIEILDNLSSIHHTGHTTSPAPDTKAVNSVPSNFYTPSSTRLTL
jgi:hypothetical protein